MATKIAPSASPPIPNPTPIPAFLVGLRVGALPSLTDDDVGGGIVEDNEGEGAGVKLKETPICVAREDA